VLRSLSRSLSRARRPLIALLVLVVALVVGYAVQGSGGHGGSGGSGPGSSSGPAGTVALSSLPPQAARTVQLIEAGGPYPYPRNDGVVFHNNEHELPGEPDGWYHEYTVPTPGASTRGARRIVTGKDGTYWYTGDHYEHFSRVDVDR
jgi:ribonuclease T1